MLMKHKLDLEKIKAKDGGDTLDADVSDISSWKQEQIIKMLEKNEKKDDEVQ